MDKSVNSVNTLYVNEARKGRAVYIDYRWMFMRPGLSFFDPYIPAGDVRNIANEQWAWTLLKPEFVDRVAAKILSAYRTL